MEFVTKYGDEVSLGDWLTDGTNKYQVVGMDEDTVSCCEVNDIEDWYLNEAEEKVFTREEVGELDFCIENA